MKYRKLRIAWSVGWSMVCISLILLWGRSYWVFETAHGTFGNYFVNARSLPGQLSIGVYDDVFSAPMFEFVSPSTLREQYGSWLNDEGNRAAILGSGTRGIAIFLVDSSGRVVLISYWFPTVLLPIFAGVPWLPWRFSLRTLLIGMTVAAIGLGWLVYAVRQ